MEKLTNKQSMQHIMRTLCTAFYDEESDGIREKPEVMTLNLAYNDEQLDLMRRLTEILLFTSYTNLAVKAYLMSKNSTYEKVGAELRMKPDTVKSNVYNCAKRFSEAIPQDQLVELMMNAEVVPEGFATKVKKLQHREKYGKKTPLGLLGIQLRKADEVAEISEQEVDALIEILKPYSRAAIARLNEVLTDEMVGYLRYISNYELGYDADLENYKKIVDAFSE